MDAAGLEKTDNAELVVESIQINDPTITNCEECTNDLNKCEDLKPASSSSTTVSTLLVSERTCSGSESVQILSLIHI